MKVKVQSKCQQKMMKFTAKVQQNTLVRCSRKADNEEESI